MDIIANISSAISIAQKLRELGKKVSEADFKMMLADLTSALGDAKLDAANLKIELAQAKNEILRLQDSIESFGHEEPEIHDSAYVFGDRTRHYCTGCYDMKKSKVLLNELTSHWTHFGKWQCPSCDKYFGPAKL